jgi:hypothetical protein
MKHVLTLVIIALVLTSTAAVAQAKRIHVTAQVVQQTFTGDIGNPQLGDQLITSVVLFDEHNTQIGTGTGACTVVSVPPLATRLQCLLSSVFAGGQITLEALPRCPRSALRQSSAFLGDPAISARRAAKQRSS